MFLLKALCLVLVIEGMPLFLAPAGIRKAALTLVQMNERSLRMLGLVSMLSGAGLLVLLK